MADTLKPWDDVEEGLPDQRRVFTVRSDVVQSRASQKRFTVDRLMAPDWVTVVALTPDDKIVLVRQWRFGVRAFTLELPAGLVESGEDPLAAGVRELREETGYAPCDVAPRLIGRAWPNPAFMGNVCHTVLATGVRCVGAQDLDPMEEVEVVTVPIADLDDLTRRGELSTALALVGLAWWRLDAGRSQPV
jgi:8-oxo-dGTP pyrophosphatase MutT (NUDIX family)